MNEGSLAGAGSRGPRRQLVFVHVGPPKTGTTFLQQVLWRNRETLRQDGILYPAPSRAAHALAAADLRGALYNGYRNPAVPGSWDKVAVQVRQWPRTSVISHEWLAFARARHARRAVRSLQPAEVHVVVTLRDVGRQVPAVWQEQIKNGQQFGYGEFLASLARPDDAGPGQAFWRSQDPRGLLRRWSSAVPPERIHVVTVPPSGSPPDLLWERFAGLFCADPGRYDTSAVSANPGLSTAEAELVRRVNVALDGRLPRRRQLQAVKWVLAQRVLSGRSTQATGKASLPAEYHAPVATRAVEIIAALREGGYHVVGDLDDLAVAAPAADTGALPEETAPDELVDAAAYALAELLTTMRERRESGADALAGPRP